MIASAFSGVFPILGQKCEISEKFFIISGISGFCRISSVYSSGRCKNTKFEPNFHRECIFFILPNFGGKHVKFEPNLHRQWNFWFCRISSFCMSGRCKNAKLEPNFHRKCIFLILPNFGGKNVKFELNFHRQWNFWILPDFKCLQVKEVQQCVIRAKFSSRVHFLDFARCWGQKCEI